MMRDIEFHPVNDVNLAITKDDTAKVEKWNVYIINKNSTKIHDILIASKGYGEREGIEQKTSTLRHYIPFLGPKDYGKIEPIDKDIFHLFNEYWVSYYIGNQIYDKKFIFVPDTIYESNFSFIEELNKKGILHT